LNKTQQTQLIKFADMLFKKMTNNPISKGTAAAAVATNNKRSNSVKSTKTINRISYSSTITSSSTIRSSVTQESTAPSSPSTSPILIDDDISTINNKNNSTSTIVGGDSTMYKSVAPPQTPGLRLSRNFQVEEEKAKQLREEIARQSMDLQKLEEIAAELQVPKVGRVQQTTNHSGPHESSIFSSSVSSLHNGTSTRVIETLQYNIDTLKRELRDQTEIAREEARGREALAKRCDIIESSQAILKHQYESMNQLLNRKERRIKELEAKMSEKDNTITYLQTAAGDYLGVQKELELKLKHFEEERNRLEVGYKALLESSKSLKQKYHQEVSAIGESIEDIRTSRRADLEKLAALEAGMSKQIVTQGQLTELENKSQVLQAAHIDSVQKLYQNMHKAVGDSDQHIKFQVDHVRRLVEQLDKYLGEKPNSAPLSVSLSAALRSFPLSATSDEIAEG
jgi:hypothetical protein